MAALPLRQDYENFKLSFVLLLVRSLQHKPKGRRSEDHASEYLRSQLKRSDEKCKGEREFEGIHDINLTSLPLSP